MTPGFAKSRKVLFYLPYPEPDRVIINSHNFNAPAFDLLTDAAPVVWLDAPDATSLFDATSGGSNPAADGNVRRWQDKSGNARHATLVSGTPPIRKTSIINSLDVVRFNSTFLQIPHASALVGSSGISIYCICRTSSTTANKGVLGKWSAGGGTWALIHMATPTRFVVQNVSGGGYTGVNNTAMTLNAATLLSGHYHSTDSRVRCGFNGTLTETTSFGIVAGRTDPVGIGTYGNDTTTSMIGDIGEVVITAGNDSTELRQKIEGYLANRWGIAASLPSDHPYKSVAP